MQLPGALACEPIFVRANLSNTRPLYGSLEEVVDLGVLALYLVNRPDDLADVSDAFFDFSPCYQTSDLLVYDGEVRV